MKKETQYYKILILIVFLGVVARLFYIDSPLTDCSQQRQSFTAMTTRNLFEDGINIRNILTPYYDHYGNRKVVLILELPILNILTALLYHIFGVREIVGRLVSVGFSVCSIFLMFRLALKFLPYRPALVATAVYTFSPLNVYFGRAFQPDSVFLFFVVCSTYVLLEYLEKETLVLFILAVLSAAMCFLSKLPGVILLVPFGYAWFCRFRWNVLRRWDGYIFLAFSVIPVIGWVGYGEGVNTFPSTGGMVSIIYEFAKLQFLSIGYWFKIISYLFIVLLTPVGGVLFFVGFFAVRKHPYRWMLYTWLISIFAFCFLFTAKAAAHPHYHLLLLAPGAIMIGFAAKYFVDNRYFIFRLIRKNALSRGVTGVGIIVVLLGYGYFFYKFVPFMYDTKRRIPYHLEAAEFIRENTPTDAVFIVNDPPNVDNPTLTYYAHRKSFKFKMQSGVRAIDKLEELRRQGGSLYVAIDSKYGSGVQDTKSNEQLWNYLKSKYEPLVINDHYMIYDLRST